MKNTATECEIDVFVWNELVSQYELHSFRICVVAPSYVERFIGNVYSHDEATRSELQQTLRGRTRAAAKIHDSRGMFPRLLEALPQPRDACSGEIFFVLAGYRDPFIQSGIIICSVLVEIHRNQV